MERNMAKKNARTIFTKADARERITLEFEDGIALASGTIDVSVCVREKDSTSKALQLIVNVLGTRPDDHDDDDDDLEVILDLEDMLPIADVLDGAVLDFVSFSDVGFDHDWSERLTIAMDAFLNTKGTLYFGRIGPNGDPMVEFRIGKLTTIAIIEDHEAELFLTIAPRDEDDDEVDDSNERISEEVDEGPST